MRLNYKLLNKKYSFRIYEDDFAKDGNIDDQISDLIFEDIERRMLWEVENKEEIYNFVKGVK